MFDTKFAVDSFSQIASVAPVTLLIAIVAAVVGLLLAILVAVVRERQVKGLAPIVAVIVSFVRGTPIIVQLYVVYYGLPQLLVVMKGWGWNTNPNGLPAAVAVGMTPLRAIIQIVVPQLIANLIPNFTNIFLDLIKDTALVYNIGIVEIMGEANIISAIGFKYLETYVDALIIYIIICWFFAKLFQVIELIIRRSSSRAHH